VKKNLSLSLSLRPRLRTGLQFRLFRLQGSRMTLLCVHMYQCQYLLGLRHKQLVSCCQQLLSCFFELSSFHSSSASQGLASWQPKWLLSGLVLFGEHMTVVCWFMGGYTCLEFFTSKSLPIKKCPPPPPSASLDFDSPTVLMNLYTSAFT
jgi:hypothetical protein